MKSKLVLSLSFVLLAACGGSEETPTIEACPADTVRNTVTGACVSPGGNSTVIPNSRDSGQTVSDMAAAEPDMPTAVDMAVTQDLGSSVDMGDDKDDAGGTPETPIRFVALGDTGEGSATQIKVGQAVGTACATYGGCDFGMLLGDNVYDSGVDSVNDARFDSMFVIPYGALQFPFYAVLGNHDLGGDGLGLDLDFEKGNYQVQYSNVNPMWQMPAKHYQATEGPVWLVGLNTTDVFFDQADAQKADVLGWLNNAPADTWKIAFGHHPYISNGPHGNAGEYEGLPFVPIANGKAVKDFMDDAVCGKFDLYICGHDHSRQDLVSTCGTEFVVSGAGAKTTDLEGSNSVHFEADTEGFLMVEATSRTLILRFFDENAVMEHERTLTR